MEVQKAGSSGWVSVEAPGDSAFVRALCRELDDGEKVLMDELREVLMREDKPFRLSVEEAQEFPLNSPAF